MKWRTQFNVIRLLQAWCEKYKGFNLLLANGCYRTIISKKNNYWIMPYMTKGLGLSLNRRNQSRRKQKRNTTFHYSHEPWYSGIWYSSLTSAVASLTARFYSNNSLMQGCCNHYVVTSTKQRKQQTVVTVCNKSKTKLSLANSAKITKPN